MQAQGQNLRSFAGNISGGGNGAVPTPAVSTINQRLDAQCAQLYRACQRIESTLARINGTPQAGEQAQDKVAVTPPMLQSVDFIEQQVERLTRLADGLEQVA